MIYESTSSLALRGFVIHPRHGVVELWCAEVRRGLKLELRCLGRREAFASVSASLERTLEFLEALSLSLEPQQLEPAAPELLGSSFGLSWAGGRVFFPLLKLESLRARSLGTALAAGGGPYCSDGAPALVSAQHSLLLSLLTPSHPLEALYSGVPRSLLRAALYPGGDPLSAATGCFEELLERAICGTQPVAWSGVERRLEATVQRDLLGGAGGQAARPGKCRLRQDARSCRLVQDADRPGKCRLVQDGGYPFERSLGVLLPHESAALWSHRLLMLRLDRSAEASQALISAAWGDAQHSKVVHYL